MEGSGKVVTLGNLSTFKAKMDLEVDKKIEDAGGGGGSVVYATDEDIEALFEEAPSNSGGGE